MDTYKSLPAFSYLGFLPLSTVLTYHLYYGELFKGQHDGLGLLKKSLQSFYPL